MNTYDVICPICGAVNCSLLLEETDGWMECEVCGTTTRSRWKAQAQKPAPVFVIRKPQARNAPAD